MNRRTTKIFGPPGTGKTTRLLQIVEDAMARGIRPERIAFMTFTRKAANEAAVRAKERFGFGEERMPWFRTLHSMAFRDLYCRRDDIIQEKHYQELGRKLGFPFTSFDDEYSMMPIGTALGDRAARIEALSRVRGITLEAQWNKTSYRDVPWAAVRQWAEGLRLYKESRGMMDYTDLLEQFNTALPIDIFIVDEAQDLSPLQWQTVRRAARDAERVYIAGDDDQCIYGWAGSDVDHFLRLQAPETEVLPVSFRLPHQIYQLAERIVQGIQQRQPKQWTSREEPGRIERVMYESSLDLSKGSWLLLARNRQFLSRFVEVLENQGYPYWKDNRHSTDNHYTRAVRAWEQWRRGNPLKPSEVKPLIGLIPGLDRWMPKEIVYMDDAPLPREIKQRSWMDVLQIPARQREYIRACLANREPLTGKPRITVSTIHRVKGGEADHVALITDVSQKPWEQAATDEERRVFYVAVTRARESFTVIQPATNRYCRLF